MRALLKVTSDFDSLWQGISAVNQLGLIVTEGCHTSHGIGEFAGPLSLVTDKSFELFSDSWMDSELSVRWEDEDVLGRRCCIAVVLDVPHTWTNRQLVNVEITIE